MVRVRKEVDGLDHLHPIAAFNQHGQVPRQRVRLAGHVGHPARPQPKHGVQRAAVAARPGRVEDEGVRRFLQRRQHVFRLAQPELDVGRVLRVHARVLHRRGRFLDGDDAPASVRQQPSEHPHARIGVDQQVRRLKAQLLPHQLHHGLRRWRVDLEEGGRRHLELLPQHRLRVVLLPAFQFDARPNEPRLHQVVAGVDPVAHRELRRLRAPLLQMREGVVDPRVHQVAAIDAQEASRRVVDVTERSPRPDCEPRVVPVPRRRAARHGRQRRHVLQARRRPQRALDAVAFDLQLVLVRNMPPLAAGARPESTRNRTRFGAATVPTLRQPASRCDRGGGAPPRPPLARPECRRRPSRARRPRSPCTRRWG